jgi:AcrR family transcriptional regulator
MEWIRPPQQERSQKTLERLLDAAESLFLQKGYERTGVVEICQKAGSSVGAFYARFPDKHALLRQIHDRFCDQAIATIESVLAPGAWEGVATADFLRHAIGFMLSVFQERRELIGALSRTEMRDPSLPSFTVRISQVMAERSHAFLVARAEPMAHPDPRAAIGFLCWLVLSAFEAHTTRHNVVEPMSSEKLVEHIVQVVQSTMGIRPTPIAHGS